MKSNTESIWVRNDFPVFELKKKHISYHTSSGSVNRLPSTKEVEAEMECWKEPTRYNFCERCLKPLNDEEKAKGATNCLKCLTRKLNQKTKVNNFITI